MTAQAEAQSYLVVANAYPSAKARYRNGFIHSRVQAYQRAGLDVQVFYFHPPVLKQYEYTHENVGVTVGSANHYRTFLQSRTFSKILVHFPQRHMVEPVLEGFPEVPIIAWVHGFETEAWHRRWFNFLNSPTEIESILEQKKDYYDSQLKFMKELFLNTTHDVTIVQVSHWFAKHISHVDVKAVPAREYVIPNFIDDQAFPYDTKNDSLRYRVLSIRPYASWKYANDQTAAAILALAETPDFDRFHFTICGDGPLFEKTTQQLRQFPNVELRRGFFNQDEIRRLHREHGVFLAPTRFDSQGVSMCEAMASGLVPLTTDIAAVPEFVEHGASGLLAAPEAPEDLAEWLDLLGHSPKLFQALSEGAARRVREQCSSRRTVAREMELIQE